MEEKKPLRQVRKEAERKAPVIEVKEVKEDIPVIEEDNELEDDMMAVVNMPMKSSDEDINRQISLLTGDARLQMTLAAMKNGIEAASKEVRIIYIYIYTY